MIQILKQAPITFNGVDGWEVLIKDDELDWIEDEVCLRCMYRDWREENDTPDTCDIVHGCTLDMQTYIEFRKERIK